MIPEEVLSTTVGDETVLLNLRTGTYFGLDVVGTRFFQLLSEAGCLSTVHRMMMDEFDVSAERLEHDLLHLSEQLATKGLLSIGEG
jgi:uncharacterized membrane protein YheB (UPF0754 family)